MAGNYRTRGGQSPTIAKPRLGGFVLAPPHSATPLSNHVNNQFGGGASPVHLAKYLFSLIIFTILSSLYISKKRYITKQKQNKNLSIVIII